MADKHGWPSGPHKYSEDLPVVKNVLRRNGQFEWHDSNCDIQIVYQDKASTNQIPTRGIWCVTHGQWAYETPIKVTWEFEDGEKLEKDLRIKKEDLGANSN